MPAWVCSGSRISTAVQLTGNTHATGLGYLAKFKVIIFRYIGVARI
jgi:hypothetical protein